MITQSAAKIYLSEHRGINESDTFRSYSTFNFGNYFSDHRFPFGSLYVVNDDSLAAGQSLKMYVQESSYLILLPIVGAVSYHDGSGNENLVNAGQMQILATGENYFVEFANPYESDLINFIQVWIRRQPGRAVTIPDVINFELDKNQNSLAGSLPIPCNSSDDFLDQPRISIGKFTGRNEGFYKKNKPANGLFVFVIEGAFEVNGRLLHPRDGLSLSGEEIELEALSNDAIVFIMELSM